MPEIITVLGPVSPGKLGHCQCHEHLWIEGGKSAEINPDLRIDSEDKSAAELSLYYTAGGRALVDAQPVGCGRNPAALATLSRRSGVHIVASTGFHKMIFYPEEHWIFRYGTDRLTRLFTEELTTGMHPPCDDREPEEAATIRAGIIKAALDEGAFSAQYEKLFSAASEAVVETGSALIVHIEKGSDPVKLADFLFRQAVDLNRVLFCHMDRSTPDLGIHRELCGRGIYMEYDTVARYKYHGDERELAIILALLDAGFEDRLLLSLDTTRSRLCSYGGGIGLYFIRKSFLPLLSNHGVTREQLDCIFLHNPARVLAQ